MTWHSITRNSNDIEFSNYIRTKADWKCEYCKKVCKVGDTNIYRLEASHYITRGKWSTRYDPQNVYALCSTCHKRMGGYKPSGDGEYDLWVKEKLGEIDYKKLIIRANTSNPLMKDKVIVKMYIKQLWTQKH